MTEAALLHRNLPGFYVNGVPAKLGPGWLMIFDFRTNTVCFSKGNGDRVIMEDGVNREDDKMWLPSGCQQSLATLAPQIARLIALSHGLVAKKAHKRIHGRLILVFEAP